MRRRDWLRCLPVLALGLARPAGAQPAHTRQDAMQLIQRAAEFLRSHGREAALAAFDDPHGAFRDGDLYLYVLDAHDDQLTMLAHGANPGLIGMPQRDIVDADGKDFNAETLRITAVSGSGWVAYKWPNPVTRKISPKLSYVQRVDDLILGAGIYE